MSATLTISPVPAKPGVLVLTIDNGRMSAVVYSAASAGAISKPVAEVTVERGDAWSLGEAFALAQTATGSLLDGMLREEDASGEIVRHRAATYPVRY